MFDEPPPSGPDDDGHGRDDDAGRSLSTAEADAVVAAVLAAGPGGWAATQLDEVSLSQVSPEVQLDLLKAWQAQQAWTQARSAAVLAGYLGPVPDPDPDPARFPDAVSNAGLGWRMRLGEAAVVLRLSETTVRNQHAVGQALASRLPATKAALEAGRISWLHALVTADATTALSDQHAGAVDAQVMAEFSATPASDQPNPDQLPVVPTPANLRRRLRRAVIAADPDVAVAAARAAYDRRGVRVWSQSDGSGHLEAWSDYRDTWTLQQALTLLAGARQADDPRSLDARRFDALLGAVLGAVDASTGHPHTATPADADDRAGTVVSTDHPNQPPAPRRRRGCGVELQVVVDLATLAGLANHPAELPGYSPIPADIVREWLPDATSWRRLVTDPVTGHLLDYGTATRFAPPPLQQYLQARDRRCVFPDCHQPATRCDADHHPPWKPDGTGGSTSASDMAMICRQHHNWLTHGGWTLHHLPDGTHRFTSPTGRTYHTRTPPTLPTE